MTHRIPVLFRPRARYRCLILLHVSKELAYESFTMIDFFLLKLFFTHAGTPPTLSFVFLIQSHVSSPPVQETVREAWRNNIKEARLRVPFIHQLMLYSMCVVGYHSGEVYIFQRVLGQREGGGMEM
jgi:hypothetical protein